MPLASTRNVLIEEGIPFCSDELSIKLSVAFSNNDLDIGLSCALSFIHVTGNTVHMQCFRR